MAAGGHDPSWKLIGASNTESTTRRWVGNGRYPSTHQLVIS